MLVASAVSSWRPSRWRRARLGFGSRDYIARIRIQGLIRGDHDRVEALDRLGRSSAKAVIVHIDSPGGTTAGSEQLYDALTRLKAKKPMVVVVDGLAASGGYMAALASDHIIAQETSLVGSIGVLFQYPNFTDLLKTIGVQVEVDQVVAAQGFAERLRADQSGGARGDRIDRASTPMPGSRTWCRPGASMDQALLTKVVRRPGVHRPSGPRSSS